jgi:hypothetical protein
MPAIFSRRRLTRLRCRKRCRRPWQASCAPRPVRAPAGLRSSIRLLSRPSTSSGADFSSAAIAFSRWSWASRWRRAASPVKRLDAAHPGRHSAFGKDCHEADIAGAPHMGAATQLQRPGPVGAGIGGRSAHGDHAHLLAVFLAEQRHGAGLHRLLDLHHPGRHLVVLEDDGIGQILDGRHLLCRHRLGVGEVEAQPVGRDQRALLGDVIAQHLAQRSMDQMGRGMIGAHRAAPGMIDLELERHARLDNACLDTAEMHPQIAGALLGVGDEKRTPSPVMVAGVADLAAGFGVERRLVEDDRAVLAGSELADLDAVARQRAHLALGGFGVVAEELGRAPPARGSRTRPFPPPPRRSRPRTCAPPRAGAPLPRRNRRDRPRCRGAQRVLGEIEWKAVGVVEPERDLARPACRRPPSPRSPR